MPRRPRHIVPLAIAGLTVLALAVGPSVGRKISITSGAGAAGYSTSARLLNTPVVTGGEARISVSVRGDAGNPLQVDVSVSDPMGETVFQQSFADQRPQSRMGVDLPLSWQVPHEQPLGRHTLSVTVSQDNGARLHAENPAVLTFEVVSPTNSRFQNGASQGNATAMATRTPTATPAGSTSGLTVFGDALAPGWHNWSWGSSVNFGVTAPVQSGSRALALTATSGWGALSLQTDQLVDTKGYTSLRFSAHATKADQRYNVYLRDADNRLLTSPIPLETLGGDPPAGAWKSYEIPLSTLNAAGKQVRGIVIQSRSASAQPALYVDDVHFGGAAGPAPAPTAVKTPSPAPTAVKTPTTTSTPVRTPTATPAPVMTATPTPTRTATPAPATRATEQKPGFVPLSDAQAAARVRPAAERRPENTTANQTKPSAAFLAEFNQPANQWTGVTAASNAYRARVTGNFTGTTDEIIQWAAWKWGFDEDVVRAVATNESWWRQSTRGDWRSDATQRDKCVRTGIALETVNGATGCYQSYGLLQIKATVHRGTWTMSRDSTAFNIDYVLAWYRSVYDGHVTWLKQRTPQPGYPAYQAGDMWGTLGQHFSGGWYTRGAVNYIEHVKQHLNARTWEKTNF